MPETVEFFTQSTGPGIDSYDWPELERVSGLKLDQKIRERIWYQIIFLQFATDRRMNAVRLNEIRPLLREIEKHAEALLGVLQKLPPIPLFGPPGSKRVGGAAVLRLDSQRRKNPSALARARAAESDFPDNCRIARRMVWLLRRARGLPEENVSEEIVTAEAAEIEPYLHAHDEMRSEIFEAWMRADLRRLIADVKAELAVPADEGSIKTDPGLNQFIAWVRAIYVSAGGDPSPTSKTCVAFVNQCCIMAGIRLKHGALQQRIYRTVQKFR